MTASITRTRPEAPLMQSISSLHNVVIVAKHELAEPSQPQGQCVHLLRAVSECSGHSEETLKESEVKDF